MIIEPFAHISASYQRYPNALLLALFIHGREFRKNVLSFVALKFTQIHTHFLGVPAKRTSVTYTCCPEPYVDINFQIHIRRRTLYYGFNLIIPCVILSSMVLLGFTLPPESGEKLTLGVTILLSMTVFMLQLSETLPPTSESVSIIGE